MENPDYRVPDMAAPPEIRTELDRADDCLIGAADGLRQYLACKEIEGDAEHRINTDADAEAGSDAQDSVNKPDTQDTTERRLYMRNKGFLLFTDAGHRLAEAALDAVTPRGVDPSDVSHMSWNEADNPSGAHLGIVANSLANQLEDLTDDRDALYALCDVTTNDIDAQDGLAIHQNGFADMDFTWRSSAAILNHVLAEYESVGGITQQERANLKLSGYAQMLESEWFIALMEDLALTSNGKYGTFGRFPGEYQYEKVKNLPPFKTASRSFEFKTGEDSLTQSKHLFSARVSDELRYHLRAGKGDSPGCPVARHHGSLPTEVIATNHHAQHLIATGRMKITEVIGNRSRFTQEQTPIGAKLKVLAKHLRDYDARFGAPHF